MAPPKTEAHFSAVIPVLNAACSIPTTVPLPLSEHLSFRKIRADDLAIITEKDEAASGFVNGGSFTFTISSFDPNISENDLNKNITAAVFSINVLGNGNPISVEKFYILKTHRKTSLHSSTFIRGHSHSNREKFTISKNQDLSYAANLFGSIERSFAKQASLQITLSRFNSAIGRTSPEDKLIDLCISLESIFDSGSEIAFQFSLYNSILSEEDSVKRVARFNLLKRLYSKRSKVVHGSKSLDNAWFNDNWNDLLKISKASILRKIDFLSQNQDINWKSYLESLALGTKYG